MLHDNWKQLSSTNFLMKNISVLIDPIGLQRAFWWFISLHFGFRARDEARKLCWGDVGLVYDHAKQKEYLTWYCERGTKTRTGKENEQKRLFNPVVYATGTNRCPIEFYKSFRSHRPTRGNEGELSIFSNCKTQCKSTRIYLVL